MFKTFLPRQAALALFICPALLVSACGDLVPAPYEGVPYTHERTAGRGVQYVRASMLPPREANTIMIQQTPTASPVVTMPPPATQGDKLFENKQVK